MASGQAVASIVGRAESSPTSFTVADGPSVVKIRFNSLSHCFPAHDRNLRRKGAAHHPSERFIDQGIEHHKISGVSVPIYSDSKTLADIFRNPKLVKRSVGIEGLKSAHNERKTTPSEIAEAAKTGGAWRTMKPYLEALTSNG